MSRDSKHKTDIHGNVEKLTQIEKVEGDVIIHHPSKLDGASLLKRGIQLLKVHAYDHAITTLTKAVEADPLLADAQYYLALASLKGSRPRVLTRSQAKAIEQKLRTACALDGSKAHYFYLWALVKFDFYVINGFLVRPPGVEELLLAAQQCPYSDDAVAEMLEHVPGADGRVVSIILGG
jgi:hypothetical protein